MTINFRYCLWYSARRIFIAVMLTTIFFCAYGQEMRSLSQTEQERIDRLEELADYYLRGDEIKKAVSYFNQISYIYWENQRPDKAAESFQRTIPWLEKINDLENLQHLYSNIALIYLDLEDLAKAEEAFTKNLEIRRSIGESQGIVTALVDLAYVKNLLKDHREAVGLLEEAMQIALSINYENVLPNIYRQLSNNYMDMGNIKLGEENRQKYNDIREHLSRETMRGEFQEREEQSQVEVLRSQAEARARKAEMELQEIIFQQEQDSIRLVVRQREDSLELARLRAESQMVEIERMEQEAELNSAIIAQQEAVQDFQLLVIYSIAGGLFLMFILAVIIFFSYKAKQRSNKQLETKNIQIEQAREKLQEAFEKIEDQNFRITQSITYAREIQRALFPPIDNLNRFLPESFIFFRPVDLVSGDFYWFREAQLAPMTKTPQVQTIPSELTDNTPGINGNWLPYNGDKFIITAVDCTGHGVPGAFMSMIGYNLLDSITGSGVTKPDEILGNLHYGVRQALKQDETTNRDGMDISLCVINKSDRTVEFSGANNPVLYIRDGEVHMVKGDRMPIGGGSQKRTGRNYQSHTIKVDAPTSFYILTDGYTDQFGGEEGRKFSMKSFKELLLNIYQKPMPEQREILETHFNNWKASEDQIDDVLVIGFKLG